jgi:MFS transporter, PAT family, beta-lactamase induction signal transducer AmpG
MISLDSFFSSLKNLANRRIGVVLALGVASGLPLALTGGTLQAWMTVEGVDLTTIGFFTLVGLPYTIKFLWAPLMDRFVPPLLGRRRGWMLLCQLALAICIFSSSLFSPKETPWLIAGLALMIAFFSASHDIVVDAYRADVLPAHERGMGAAVFVSGYRFAMLISGAVALMLSEYLGWRVTYVLISVLMLTGMLAVWWGPEPMHDSKPPATLGEAVVGPLKDFFMRNGAVSFLILIILYKLGDAFAGSLTTAFLIRGPGFSLTEVGALNKGLGLAATILGALFGGALMVRLGLYGSLMLFGILQAVSNLSFMILAYVGKSYLMLITAVGFENLAGGMGTAAFVALLMALCHARYSAAQFALLSALAALGRVYVGPASGFLAEDFGWVIFFLFTFFIALPGLFLLWRMKKSIESIDVPWDAKTQLAD